MVDGLVISKEKTLFEEFYVNFSGNLTSFEYADSIESARNAIDLLIPDYVIIIEKSVKTILEIINTLFQNETIINPQVFLKYEIYRISLEKIFISFVSSLRMSGLSVINCGRRV